MDPKDSAVNDFLNEFSNDKEVNPFEDNLKDPFAQEESQEQTKDEETKEEKSLPFHKDPKVQKFIDKEIEKRLKDIKPAETKVIQEPAEDEVTDVLTRLIGNDTSEKLSMIKEFKNVLEKGTQRAKAEAIAELQAQQDAQLQADKEAEEELANAFEQIEETYEVDISSNNALAKKTRQEFVAFIEKIAPKDKNGNIADYPDMPSAWETFSQIKKSTQQPNRAKELASRSMARSTETKVETTKKSTWDDVLEQLAS